MGFLTAYADQVRDVSLFLYQCAVSVEMELQPRSSSASYEDIMYALVSHYDYGTEMVQKKKATNPILIQIQNGKP